VLLIAQGSSATLVSGGYLVGLIGRLVGASATLLIQEAIARAGTPTVATASAALLACQRALNLARSDR
jgi:hypothetical protein